MTLSKEEGLSPKIAPKSWDAKIHLSKASAIMLNKYEYGEYPGLKPLLLPKKPQEHHYV